MNYWAQLANHHWKKFLPKMYHTYQDQGILDQELEKAGKRAEEMIGELIEQGLRPEEAKEIALPQTVLLTPESAHPAPSETDTPTTGKKHLRFVWSN